MLRARGVKGVQDYVTKEVQSAYRNSGVDINDKHIEVIVRQMLRKVKIESQGSTDMLPGTLVDIFAYEDANQKTLENGGEPAKANVRCSVSRKPLSRRNPSCRRHRSRKPPAFLPTPQSRTKSIRCSV